MTPAPAPPAPRPHPHAPLEPLGDDELFAMAREKFAAGNWFDAHEAWEVLWIRRKGRPEARVLQGLIQLAAAEWQRDRGRPGPTAKLAVGALAKIGEGEELLGMPLEPFRQRASRLAGSPPGESSRPS